MADWALTLFLAYLLIVFGLKTVLQKNGSGSSGWVHGLGATLAERGGNVVFLVAIALDVLGPTLVVTGTLRPTPALNNTLVHVAGVGLIGLAALGARQAQATMGSAWRTGIDPGTRQELVTCGWFAIVRNPVYVTMLGASLGVALLAPTGLTLIALPLCFLALEVQTRLVEEPCLFERHGGAYLAYTQKVGRFVPRRERQA